MTAAETVLEVRDLSVRYRLRGGETVTALHPVRFTLGRGEMLGVAGESGSGKSTLALAVARLLPPGSAVVQGSVRLGAQELLRLSEPALRPLRWARLALVLQSAMNALNPVLTVGAQIEDALRAHEPIARHEARARVHALLQAVHIPPERARSYPHELSGGMRQRAAIAMSLALHPDVVLFDEPTTALDVVVQRQILDEIRQLQARFGFAALFITHDLCLLLEVAQAVMVLYAGRVVERAPVAGFRAGPLHPYSRGLLASTPRVRGPRSAVSEIPGSPPDLRRPPGGCPFHPRCPLAGPLCREVVPPLRERAPGWFTACHWNDRGSPEGVPA